MWLAALTIAFALGLHIYRLSGMAFTNYDDMLMGLTADRMRTQGWWASYYDLARTYAVWQGRIYFYFSMIFFLLPFLIRSLALRAVISAALQMGAVCAVGTVVGMYAGFAQALLFVALACAWMPYWPAVSPIIGFPFYYHLPVLLFFSGLALWIARRRGRLARWPRTAAIVGWGAFFVSMFFYEALAPPFCLIALLAAAAEAYRVAGGWERATLIRTVKPWVVGFGIWAVVYLTFRKLQPGTYEGSSFVGLGHGQMGPALTSLRYFESYSLPGANWFGNLHWASTRLWGTPQSLGVGPYFFRNLTWDAAALAVLSAALLLVRALAWRREDGARPIGKTAVLALVCAVLAPLPLSFTAKYRIDTNVLDLAPYLPGYYAYLAWCAAAALGFVLALRALALRPLRWAAALAMALVCALVVSASATMDDAVYRDFDQVSDKWKLIDRLARSGWFAALPPHAVFLAPGLWDNFPHTTWYHGDPYWTAYFSAWAGRNVPVIRLPQQVPGLLRQHTPVVYCEHQWLAGRKDSVLVLEPITALSPAGDAVGDSLLLLSPSGRAGMAVEYRTAEGLRRAPIPAWEHQRGAYFARMTLAGLIAGTLEVVDGSAALPPAPLVDFGRGFSGATERDRAHYWRWSDGAGGTGEMNLVNLAERPVEVRFRASLHFDPGPQGAPAAFDIRSPAGAETVTVGAGEVIERTWRLNPGSNRIVLHCHAGRLPAPGDARYIVFGVWDWSIEPKNP